MVDFIKSVKPHFEEKNKQTTIEKSIKVDRKVISEMVSLIRKNNKLSKEIEKNCLRVY